MNSQFGAYLRQCREEAHLTPQQVVHRLGYKRLDRGANRIIELEKWGPSADVAYQNSSLLKKVIELLNPDLQKLKELNQADIAKAEAEYEEWASVPIKPFLQCYMIAGICQITDVSEKFTLEQAIKEGQEHVKSHGKPAWVVLSRRKTLRINWDGTTREISGVSTWTEVDGRRMSVAFVV